MTRRLGPRTTAVAAAVALAVAVAAAGFLIERASNPALGSPKGLVSIAIDSGHGLQLAGSGVLLNQGGEVATSADVVNPARSISVLVLGSQRRYPAFLLAIDEPDNLALLQLQSAAGLPVPDFTSTVPRTNDHVALLFAADFSQAQAVQLETSVVAVDRPVSLTNRPAGVSVELPDAIEVRATASAQAGGGGLFDSDGRLFGIVSFAGAEAVAVSGGLVYGVPVANALAVAQDAERGRPDSKLSIGFGAVIGVDVVDSHSPLGALVLDVASESPAQAAGINIGDVITSVAGARVRSSADLTALLQSHHPGERLPVVWVAPSHKTETAPVQLVTGTVR